MLWGVMDLKLPSALLRHPVGYPRHNSFISSTTVGYELRKENEGRKLASGFESNVQMMQTNGHQPTTELQVTICRTDRMLHRA